MPNEYNPDWVSPPGETISDMLDERGWRSTDFGKLMGMTQVEVAELLRGDMPISEALAERLAKEIGGTAAFWIKREEHYRAGANQR